MAEIFQGRSAAAAGIMSTLLGTLFALVLFPEDPSLKGAMTLSASVLAAGILFVPTVRFVGNSRDLMNSENFVAIGFVYWILLDPIQGAYDLYGASTETIRYALIATGVCATSMWFGLFGRPWRLPQALGKVAVTPLPTETVLIAVPLCFLLGMANFVYSVNFNLVEMFSYLGESRWSAPWARGQFGGWDAFLDHTQYFGYVLPSLAVLVVIRRGWLKPESVLAMGAALIMVLFLSQGGGRRIIGVTVGAAIIVWTLARPGVKIRKILGAGLAIAALLWAMQFVLEIRSGYEDYLESGDQYASLHVDDNFLRLAQITEFIPDQYPFVYFQQIFFILVRPIPRVIWEGKPIDPGFDLPTALGLAEVSLSSSIVGEWYLAFGWVGIVFGGWFHGRLAAGANALRKGTVAAGNPIVYALAVMVLFSGIRSMQDLIIMSYAILAWYGITWLVTRRAMSRA